MENDKQLTTLDAVKDIVQVVNNTSVINKEDSTFLVEHSQSLVKAMEKTHMWRTGVQKKSIISDSYHPTTHSKFHQVLAEQKVQFDQALYLAKDYEMKRLDLEEKLVDLEGFSLNLSIEPNKYDELNKKRTQIELQFMQYELKHMQIAMSYRMQEIRGWETIKTELIREMENDGWTEEQMYNKEYMEIEGMFFQRLNAMSGVGQSTDGAEVHNLVALARFAIQEAKDLGLLQGFVSKCNPEQLSLLEALKAI